MDINYTTSINHDTWNFSQLIIKNRFIDALNKGVTRYPIYRELRFAARKDLASLFDLIALNPLWQTQRINTRSLILDSKGLFVSGSGSRTRDYSSCSFDIWAESIEKAEQVVHTLMEHVGSDLIEEPMFSIDWNFLTPQGELESAEIEELANDILYDEAYPSIKEGVNEFITRYLNSDETVLVLQGAPGTGKTRFIRAILGEISRRNNTDASALYTGDIKALENDEIFVKFVTGWDDAFVIEDADHLLTPRAKGNEDLHRFLAIADGVIRAQGRKIIFSTNLPNVKDIDDALIRPGRCFARIHTRELDKSEAKKLVERLCVEQNVTNPNIDSILTKSGKAKYTLAELYKGLGQLQDKQ